MVFRKIQQMQYSKEIDVVIPELPKGATSFPGRGS